MKGKGAVVTQLTLSFYVITFSINSWLIEGIATIKKRCDRVPQLSMFLRMLFICILSKFWFKWKASWGCQFSLSHNIIHLLILTLGFSKLPFAMGTPEFHAQGLWQMPCENGTPRNHGYTYILHTSPLLRLRLHCLIRIHLQNPNSSFKILKISRQQQYSIKLSMRPFWVLGPVWLNRSYTHKAVPYVIFRHMTSFYNTVPQPGSGLAHQCLPFGKNGNTYKDMWCGEKMSPLLLVSSMVYLELGVILAAKKAVC